MATSILIKYVGQTVELERRGMEIARYFAPQNSYVDSPIYTHGSEGLIDEATGIADEDQYGRSIYATNVDGWGTLPGLLPMAHTTTKFAQFERAVIAAFVAKQNEEENKGITFDVEDYEDVIYWSQICKAMADDGFYCKVGDEEYGTDEASGE